MSSVSTELRFSGRRFYNQILIDPHSPCQLGPASNKLYFLYLRSLLSADLYWAIVVSYRTFKRFVKWWSFWHPLPGHGSSSGCRYQIHRCIYDSVSFNSTIPQSSKDLWVFSFATFYGGETPGWYTQRNSVNRLEIDILVVTYGEVFYGKSDFNALTSQPGHRNVVMNPLFKTTSRVVSDISGVRFFLKPWRDIPYLSARKNLLWV